MQYSLQEVEQKRPCEIKNDEENIGTSHMKFHYLTEYQALGKYHHFRKYLAESPSLRVYKW